MSTSTDQEPLVCGTCGTTPESEEDARLTWSRGIESGRAQWACDRCSREFLRSIESKLDPVWW